VKIYGAYEFVGVTERTAYHGLKKIKTKNQNTKAGSEITW
jgi:hypothetical protein